MSGGKSESSVSAARGLRSTGQLEKGGAADRPTTERLLVSIGARKSGLSEEWTHRGRRWRCGAGRDSHEQAPCRVWAGAGASCRGAPNPVPSAIKERYSLGHLSLDLLVLQKMFECPANDFVAFARSGFQPRAVDDLDSPASITYEAPRLQRLCGQCHARSAQP